MSLSTSPRNGRPIGGSQDDFNRPSDENDKLRSVQNKANEVTNIARDNIRMSLAQVDKLQDMEEKASNLEASSQDFHRGAKKVRRMMCVRSWKMMALIVLLVIILLVVIIVPIVIQARKWGRLKEKDQHHNSSIIHTDTSYYYHQFSHQLIN